MFVRRESFGQYIRSYPVVTTIIVLNLVFFLLLTIPVFPNQFIFQSLAGINLYIAEGEWWRIITPIFMHSSFSHLFFNCFSLVILAPSLEVLLRKNRFLFLYLASGIFANIATYIFEPLTYVHVGSSGAIFGLLGFLFFLAIYKKHLISSSHAQMIIVVGMIALIFSFTDIRVNITAHLAGMLFGFIYARIIFK